MGINCARCGNYSSEWQESNDLPDLEFCSESCLVAYRCEIGALERDASERRRSEENAAERADKEYFRPFIEKRVGHPLKLDDIWYNERLETYVVKEELIAEINSAIKALEKASGLEYLNVLLVDYHWKKDEKLWEFNDDSEFRIGEQWNALSRPEHLAPYKAVCAYLGTKKIPE